MAKPYWIPDFKKLYPEASEEVIAVLRVTERKMQYQEYDMKRERMVTDPATGEMIQIPSREDSYERLLENSVQFTDQSASTEEQVLKRVEIQELYGAISLLTAEEQWIIQQLYFEERTERETAEQLGIYHNAVHKQKKRILQKLKKILEKI